LYYFNNQFNFYFATATRYTIYRVGQNYVNTNGLWFLQFKC
jgi:hypothetical protein